MYDIGILGGMGSKATAMLYQLLAAISLSGGRCVNTLDCDLQLLAAVAKEDAYGKE